MTALLTVIALELGVVIGFGAWLCWTSPALRRELTPPSIRRERDRAWRNRNPLADDPSDEACR